MRLTKSFKRFRRCTTTALCALGFLGVAFTSQASDPQDVPVTPGSDKYVKFTTTTAGEDHTLNIKKEAGNLDLADSDIRLDTGRGQWALFGEKTASQHTYKITNAQLTDPLWVHIDGTFVTTGGPGVGGNPPEFDVNVVEVHITPASRTVFDGESGGQFTATVKPGGLSITKYAWRGDANPNGGNDPQTTFNPNNVAGAQTTTATTKWYAFPDSPTGCNRTCSYQVFCTATVGGGTFESDGLTVLQVEIPEEAGTVQISLQTSYVLTTEDGKYWIADKNDITINSTVEEPWYDPHISASQFNTKVTAHEQKHYNDFTGNPDTGMTVGEDYFTADTIWARCVAKGITSKDTTPCTSEQQLEAKFDECISEEDAALKAIAEPAAYAVSDPIAPCYYYQSGGGGSI